MLQLSQEAETQLEEPVQWLHVGKLEELTSQDLTKLKNKHLIPYIQVRSRWKERLRSDWGSIFFFRNRRSSIFRNDRQFFFFLGQCLLLSQSTVFYFSQSTIYRHGAIVSTVFDCLLRRNPIDLTVIDGFRRSASRPKRHLTRNIVFPLSIFISGALNNKAIM